MTGPIIFSEFRPRSHLLWYGRVYSVRDSDRTTGETWASWTRTGCAKLDVRVSKVGDLTSIPLAPYAGESGFPDADSWRSAIERVHGSLDGLGVYRVDRLGTRTPEVTV